MKFAQDIVLAPVITENSMAGIADKKYTFKVATDATKIDIANAVEELFGVKVAKVNTISVRGRYRRQGMHAATLPRARSHRHPDCRLQGDRVLQLHGLMTGWPQGRLEDPAEGFGYGDMTPIKIHKITTRRSTWLSKSTSRLPPVAVA